MVSGKKLSGLFFLPLALFASAASADNNTYSLGLEGFYDHYREPGYTVDEKAGYGSITGNYTHTWDNNLFAAIDARGSYGEDHYDSVDGSDSDIPQWELELRARGGTTFTFMGGNLSPYVGLGQRYFIDKGKGTTTNLGYVGYDRRIWQLYAPIGMSYSFVTDDNWSFVPNIEFDPLIYGNVNSRLQNDGYYNLNNTQHDGYGWRGEFMVGHKEQTFSWQAGPFVRYWNIKDSDVTTTPDGKQWIEPQNDRLQVGIALRALW